MAALSAEQVERFRRDGYLIVDGLFDTQSLEPVRRRIRELAAPDAPEMVKGKRQVEPLVEAGEMRADGYAASLRKMSHMAFEDPVFLTHAREPRIVDIIESLLGPDIVLAQDQLFMKPPRVGSRQKFHQDTPLGFHLDPPDRMVTCWCALDDMTRENGTISVMPHGRVGSRAAVFPHRHEPGSNDLVGYEGDDPGVLVEMPAGSVAVFTSTSLHRSGANTTSRLRRAYLTQYTRAPLRSSNGELWGQAVPFVSEGQYVYDPSTDVDARTGRRARARTDLEDRQHL